ncbi:MAG: helix-turn-helix domain-containing protein [Armatimonadetes bacterium]|nr:helix-turn-helix domain-containing protein [Armatimonadota bacterium]
MSKLLTVSETADHLQCRSRKVRRLMRNDGLPFMRIGTSIRVPTDELDRWLRARLRNPVPQVAGRPLEAVQT